MKVSHPRYHDSDYIHVTASVPKMNPLALSYATVANNRLAIRSRSNDTEA